MFGHVHRTVGIVLVRPGRECVDAERKKTRPRNGLKVVGVLSRRFYRWRSAPAWAQGAGPQRQASARPEAILGQASRSGRPDRDAHQPVTARRRRIRNAFESIVRWRHRGMDC